MSLSLRDQLLKAGLVNEKQAKQATKQQQKQQRLEKKGQVEKDNSQREAALKAQAEKQARDQELNRQQQEKAEQKARAAQVKQLIERSRLPKLTTDDYYNFVDDKKVKRISVNNLMRDKLSSGSLAIVRHGGGYEIIPREAALKIQERDPRRVVLLNTRTEEVDADDPYAAYQVPDDLMW
ncbi:DUF2058 domain-containing protein [Pseudomonas sp. S5(2021)]|jgi:hypothetical protein|uniref:DUF2058 domain-containing protein n=1 Tax=Stutzerimonas balearica TaxID=74829 RepID=A0A9X7V620_9GAMM|nr:DUF2058 domain-containing protein [Stutzerimonas balearica]KIL04950.1 nucleoprotein/polynucleotide-associated enzyme [Stutzerimonas stutzeri]MBB62106.1 DUF2058 domain-containing protein [Pseudomonas sp.]MBZ5755730.1 DUF2058 domain-containing protein [Pseudomonas sp. S5(2021)]MBC7199030.1 DUF2058 domain-containing protein [Stutzerimonas balearica]MBD3735903.1 DUF2058 domain-containing protein [Stutzerimonas balearica]|tara:strand:- start:134 stop:673 length:540 start_codon:yes stop_codon:yes gene_type:complete